MSEPYQKSRRLIGPNLYFRQCGVVLDVEAPYQVSAEREAIWRQRVGELRERLGWPDLPVVARHHRDGCHLALAAPVDMLYPATDLNEAAWIDAIEATGLLAGESPPERDRAHEPERIQQRAERNLLPNLRAALPVLAERGIPWLHGDEEITLGYGHGSRSWPEDDLPAPEAIPWDYLHGVPCVLVTGTNGKTTTVRLLDAMAREAGLMSGYNCTDGLVVGGATMAAGDYAGPAGARHILRHRQVELAILETARGGILRRGLAVNHADVAVVTNISADHLGERGIHDLAGLADAKLVVAKALTARGLLILNADDPTLVAKAAELDVTLAWFGQGLCPPAPFQHSDGACCALVEGRVRLRLPQRGIDSDLGAVAEMPLSVGGRAGYNISNLLGASLAAAALGIPVPAIRAVLASFGSRNQDNPGRLQRWQFGGLQVFVDYAHNPDGLRQLLAIATAAPYRRLALTLGQAGNREDEEICQLADAAAGFRPQLVLLKALSSHLRGRAEHAVTDLLSAQLRRHAITASAPIEQEIDAVRQALQWAQADDLLVLPIHTSQGRDQAVALLDALSARGWQPGQAID